jgi:hypothetical protein
MSTREKSRIDNRTQKGDKNRERHAEIVLMLIAKVVSEMVKARQNVRIMEALPLLLTRLLGAGWERGSANEKVCQSHVSGASSSS